MVFRLALFLGLAFIGSASHRDIDGVVNSTAQVIGTLQEKGAIAEKRFANVSKFDQQLDEIGHHAEQDFDAQLYSEKMKAFAELAEHASKKAKQASSSTNASIAEELSDEADAALGNMTKVGSELDAMEKDLHDELQGALGARLDPEVAAADKFSGEASHLQKRAHSMMDPLYSWGDAAEDKADKLNDQTNDALSAVDKVVRSYRRHITRHSREVQRDVERKLFASQDRTATWRKVNRDVQVATSHALQLQYLANASVLSLQLGSIGGLAVLAITSTASAAVGALIVGFAMKMRSSRYSDYRLLPA